MRHGIYRVIGFAIDGPYVLTVRFDDGTKQRIDFEPVLGGELYRPLRDRSVFDQVRLDSEVGTLVWEARSYLHSILSDVANVDDRITTYPGGATCDLLPQMHADAARFQPALVIMALRSA